MSKMENLINDDLDLSLSDNETDNESDNDSNLAALELTF